MCRHCSIVPVYNCQFRVVLRSGSGRRREQVAQGAQHSTSAIQIFKRSHARRVVRRSRVVPGVCTRHDQGAHLLITDSRGLSRAGMLFRKPAVESTNNAVLRIRTRAPREDFLEPAGVGMTGYRSPQLCGVHTGTTMESYCELPTRSRADLVGHGRRHGPPAAAARGLAVAGVADVRALAGHCILRRTHPWRHRDTEAMHCTGDRPIVGVSLKAARFPV